MKIQTLHQMRLGIMTGKMIPNVLLYRINEFYSRRLMWNVVMIKVKKNGYMDVSSIKMLVTITWPSHYHLKCLGGNGKECGRFILLAMLIKECLVFGYGQDLEEGGIEDFENCGIAMMEKHWKSKRFGDNENLL